MNRKIMNAEEKDRYCEQTIKTYNESKYGEIPEEDFINWDCFLIPYLKQGNHILDFGCGSGFYSKRFKDRGFKVTAIDGARNNVTLRGDY